MKLSSEITKMKPLIFLFVFILCFSLAAAVEVDIPQDYSHGDKLTIPVTGCSGMSTVRITDPNGNLIHVDQGTGSWTSTYHTNSNPGSGKYVLIANCLDGTAAELTFCVDASGCNVIAVDQQPPEDRRGGGRGCSSRWSCAAWSYCDAELKQSRTCYDRNDCQDRKEQTKVCSKCEESWICTPWSGCQNNQQTRLCVDEHACGTRILKPTLQKSCVAPAAGPQPNRVVPKLPTVTPRQPTPTFGLKKYWDEYKVPIIAIPSALIVLVILIFVVIHFTKGGKGMHYNFHELKEWIGKEKEMGTSHQDITHILKKKTGWKKKDVHKAFEELKEEK